MENIKNSVGKLICKVDAREKVVEILHKGICTVIYLCDDGTCKVINTTVKK